MYSLPIPEIVITPPTDSSQSLFPNYMALKDLMAGDFLNVTPATSPTKAVIPPIEPPIEPHGNA